MTFNKDIEIVFSEADIRYYTKNNSLACNDLNTLKVSAEITLPNFHDTLGYTRTTVKIVKVVLNDKQVVDVKRLNDYLIDRVLEVVSAENS